MSKFRCLSSNQISIEGKRFNCSRCNLRMLGRILCRGRLWCLGSSLPCTGCRLCWRSISGSPTKLCCCRMHTCRQSRGSNLAGTQCSRRCCWHKPGTQHTTQSTVCKSHWIGAGRTDCTAHSGRNQNSAHTLPSQTYKHSTS